MSGPTPPAACANTNIFQRSMFKQHKIPFLILCERFVFKFPITNEELISDGLVALS